MFFYGVSIKVIGAAIAALLFFGVGVGFVVSYKNAIAKKERLEIENKAKTELLEKRLKQIESLKLYQDNQAKIVKESNSKVSKILSQRSKRDAKGNIQPDDAILHSLNSMFNEDG